jgi:hypothetical protein
MADEQRVPVAPPPGRVGCLAWGSLALAERFSAEYFPQRVIYHCRRLAGTSTEHDANLFLQAFALLESDQDTTERAA